MKLNHTDKATLAGLFLSRFNQKALAALDCTGIWQACNIVGYSLGASPASIKNYRDEFDHEIRKTDPLHPRQGWQRPLKKRSQRLYESFAYLTFKEFSDLVKTFLLPTFKQEELVSQAIKQDIKMNLAQRLMTGHAAEEYFKIHYLSVSTLANYDVEDVTSCGCGYDFHLSFNSDFYCVEVKGLASNTGSLLMTEKEYDIAGRVKDRYCLFIVRNFQKTPKHTVVFNPLASYLSFVPQPQTLMRYTAYLM